MFDCDYTCVCTCLCAYVYTGCACVYVVINGVLYVGGALVYAEVCYCAQVCVELITLVLVAFFQPSEKNIDQGVMSIRFAIIDYR